MRAFDLIVETTREEMTHRPARYLIGGMTRPQIVACLLEFRAFIREHPGDELAPFLIDTIRDLHRALHEERAAARACGGPECGFPLKREP